MVSPQFQAFVRRHKLVCSQLLGGWLASVCLGLFVFPYSVLAVERDVLVTATLAPIMDGADSDAQELGRARKGTRLITTGRTTGNWLEIKAPALVSGWVYGELIQEAQIAASSVKVRSGPGIGYPALGSLTRGDSVVVRGRRGDWVEIKGQPPLLVWIERAMVAEGAAVDLTAAAATPPEKPTPVAKPKPPPPPVAVSENKTITKPVTPSPPIRAKPVIKPSPPVAKPVMPAPVERRPEPAPVANRHKPLPPRKMASQPPSPTSETVSPVGVRLLESAPQGQPVVVSGVLRPVGVALFPPAPYRLVESADQGPDRTLCFVQGEQLLSFMERPVRLQGHKYWVAGSRNPVVLVRGINASRELTETP